MDNGRPFMGAGGFTSIKSPEACSRIKCPGCHTHLYAFQIQGSCLKVVCANCFTRFIGIVKTVNCGECEEKLKCLGLRPAPFETMTKKELPKMTSDNMFIPTDVFDCMIKNSQVAFSAIKVTKK
jgi:hypothetical protein